MKPTSKLAVAALIEGTDCHISGFGSVSKVMKRSKVAVKKLAWLEKGRCGVVERERQAKAWSKTRSSERDYALPDEVASSHDYPI